MFNTSNENVGSMDVKVTVTPMKEQEGCLKANASIILNDVFKVTGILSVFHRKAMYLYQCRTIRLGG